MPRMQMFIQNNHLPRVAVRPLGSYNTQVNQGQLNQRQLQKKGDGLVNMAFNASMVNRIAGLKPGCSACGKG